MGSPHFGFPWTASSSPRRSLVTLELKRHKFVPMVATKWALQLLSKRQRIQMFFMNFHDKSNLLERWFRKCSAVCTQCHHSTFHLRHSWKNRECPILSKQAKQRLTCCHSPTQAFKLICSIKKSEEKNRLSPKQKFLSFEPLARSFLSLELSSARANFKNYPKMTNLKKGITWSFDRSGMD